MIFRTVCAVFAFVASFANPFSTHAQFVTNSVPQVGVSDSFYENIGIHWGFRGRNFFFNNGGGGVAPVFGGYDPNASARFGFGGGGFFGSMTAGQGSTRSNVMNSSTITLPNGGVGGVYDTSLRPFVVGVVPVVGGEVLHVSSPLQERLQRLRGGESVPGNFVRALRRTEESHEDAEPVGESRSIENGPSSPTSSASRGDLSVAEIRRQQAATDSAVDQEVAALIEQARGQEELGKSGVAKIFYQQAARRATGELQRQLQLKVRELSTPASADRETSARR